MLSNGRWIFWVDILGNKFDANIRSLLRISIYLMNYFWQIVELEVMDIGAKWPISSLHLHRCLVVVPHMKHRHTRELMATVEKTLLGM